MAKGEDARHEQLQHDLRAELKSLRAAVRETAAGYILCKEGEIETLLDYLLKMPAESMKAVARPWLREARALELKPAKGRIKDLKKIDSLLQELLNSIIEADVVEENMIPVSKKLRTGSRKAGVAEVVQAV